MLNIVLKKVSLRDIHRLQKIAIETFIETFSGVNTEENMKKYLVEGFSIEKLTTEINDKNSQFYFATSDKNVLAYIKLNLGKSQTELMKQKSLEIERIYVLKEFQGKKIGQLLCDKAIQIAIQKQTHFIWLGVWEENTNAINFYKKNRFIEFDKHIFKLGNDEQIDLLMKLKLNK